MEEVAKHNTKEKNVSTDGLDIVRPGCGSIEAANGC